MIIVYRKKSWNSAILKEFVKSDDTLMQFTINK